MVGSESWDDRTRERNLAGVLLSSCSERSTWRDAASAGMIEVLDTLISYSRLEGVVVRKPVGVCSGAASEY